MVCNEAITVLVSIQVFNFVSEMYSSLLIFQSLLAFLKVHIMSVKSDAIAPTEVDVGFIVLMC